MRADDVREALESLSPDGSLEWGEIRATPGSGSYWTFDVEPACIFRFPRNDTIANELRKEIRLLPELRECVSFEVPHFEWAGRHDGRPFVGHRKLAGRALTTSDVAMSGTAPAQKRANARERLAQVMAELHGFPKQRAAQLLQVRDGIGDWAKRCQALQTQVEQRVLPILEPGLRLNVERGTQRFLEDGLPRFSHPVLVHCDLGTDHLLVDDADGRCRAIIDFETATVGDPVIDFVGLWISHGPEVTGDVLARYGGPHDAGFGERLHFYHWMGSAHAVLRGLDQGDRPLVADATRTLEARLQRPALGDRLQL